MNEKLPLRTRLALVRVNLEVFSAIARETKTGISATKWAPGKKRIGAALALFWESSLEMDRLIEEGCE